MTEKNINITLIILSAIIFIISLSQKAYGIDGDDGSKGNGLLCFLLGAFGFTMGGAALTWLANPLLFASWIIPLEKLNVKLLLSFAAVIISISFLFFSEIIKDEAGHYGKITSYKTGYWLWVLSTVIYFIGLVYIKMKETASP